MKANELRLGNTILSPDTNKWVTVELNHIKAISEGIKFNGNYYSPIPLTPEILEKAGFDRANTSLYSDRHEFNFKFINNELYYGYWDEDGFVKESRKPIIYLHQLQNLYFALTGEELMIEDLNVERSVATK